MPLIQISLYNLELWEAPLVTRSVNVSPFPNELEIGNHILNAITDIVNECGFLKAGDSITITKMDE